MAEKLFAIFPGTEATPPTPTPLDVFGAAVVHGLDPQTVTNPGQGTGGTLIYVAVVASPGLHPSGSYVLPAGVTAGDQIFDYEATAGSFVQRVRAWAKPDEGENDFTFGWTNGFAATQSAAIIALDGEATTITVTPTPVVNTSTGTGYPGMATLIDMLVLAVATQQQDDDLLAGPSVDEVMNNTASTGNRGIAVHKLRADDTTINPGPATWDGSVGAHVQFLIGASGEGGQGANQPIPRAQWTRLVEPEVPDSWNENRGGQLIALGCRYQDGSDEDEIGDILFPGNPSGALAAGYGIDFDVTTLDELHSFATEDAGPNATLRLGPRPVTGLQNRTQGLLLRHQWRNADGYDEAQETAGGQNPSTAFPGTDRTYYDGTRTQFAFIPTGPTDPKAILATFGGAGGDRVVLSSLFRIEQWMLDNDLNVAGGGVHAVGSAPSPWSHFFGQGLLQVITRDQTTAWTVANNNPTSNVRASVPIVGADVGDWWALVSEFIIDPLDGYLRVWLAKGSGGFTQIVSGVENGYGLSYADTDPNQALWHCFCANYYSWHRAGPEVALFNWDDTNGNVREMAYGYSGMFIDSAVSVTDVMRHANYYLQGA